jgi:hypothetical protein
VREALYIDMRELRSVSDSLVRIELSETGQTSNSSLGAFNTRPGVCTLLSPLYWVTLLWVFSFVLDPVALCWYVSFKYLWYSL